MNSPIPSSPSDSEFFTVDRIAVCAPVLEQGEPESRDRKMRLVRRSVAWTGNMIVVDANVKFLTNNYYCLVTESTPVHVCPELIESLSKIT